MRPDQVTLGVLISQVSREEVDAAIEVCGVREKRSDGKLPAHVTAYLTLGLALFPDDDYVVHAAVRFGAHPVGDLQQFQAVGDGDVGDGSALGGHDEPDPGERCLSGLR